MNVCLVSREYPPFFGGGIGAYTVRWSRALARAGHRVVVVTVSDDGKEGRDRDGEVDIVRLPFIRGSGHSGDWSGPHPLIATPENQAAFDTFSPVALFSMQIARALPRLVDEFAIQVVEAPDTGALAWFALNGRRTGSLWKDGGGPAFVTCVHSPTEWISHWNHTALSGRRDTELVWMERDAAAWSDGLVAPSETMSGWVAEHWGIERPEVIPYPLGELETIAQESAAERRSGLEPAEAGAVAFAGRLEPRKGVRVLLEGFTLAVGGGAELHLDLAGEDMPEGAGFHGRTLLQTVPEHIRGRIRSHGRLDGPALAATRARARTIVIPSPMDNFPNTCMEAMAEGHIVVAARAGGMAAMIRDGIDGILFEPEDAPDCARALRHAADLSPERASRMGRQAARRMLDLCGNAAITHRRTAQYAAVLAARRPLRGARTDFVVVDRGGASRLHIARLGAAATQAGAAFAHGWTRDVQGRVRAFSTPHEPTLMAAEREIGPLVVARQAARTLTRGMSSWDAALALARSGAAGVVVPEVVVPDRGPPGRIRRLLRSLRGG